jgi:hypothetical protein
VDANVTAGNSTEFRLYSAAKPNLLADVLNVPCTSNRSNDGQMEDRAFGIYVRGRQGVVRLFNGSEPPRKLGKCKNEGNTRSHANSLRQV